MGALCKRQMKGGIICGICSICIETFSLPLAVWVSMTEHMSACTGTGAMQSSSAILIITQVHATRRRRPLIVTGFELIQIKLNY